MRAGAMEAEAAPCNADRGLHSNDQSAPTHNANHRGEHSPKPSWPMKVPTLINEAVWVDQPSETDQKHTATGHCEKDLEVRHLAPLAATVTERRSRDRA
jgi:hypothetical protein